MDTVKTRILHLEKQVASLEEKLQIVNKKSTGISHPIHYVSSTEEFLEYDIFDELNAFRFVYTKKNDSQGKPCFEYTLVNPTESMKKLMRDEHGNEENITLISYTPDPAKIEEFGYEMNNHNPQYMSVSPLANPNIKKQIKDELDNYFFRVYDICNCDIRPVNFDQDISVSFRNTYKTIPHFNIYFTPFSAIDHLTWKVKELTTSGIIITVSFPNIPGGKLLNYNRRGNQYETPEGIRLHLWVHGICEQKEENLLE